MEIDRNENNWVSRRRNVADSPSGVLCAAWDIVFFELLLLCITHNEKGFGLNLIRFPYPCYLQASVGYRVAMNHLEAAFVHVLVFSGE